MLTTPALGLIEENFKDAIQEGPNYICDICWKFKFPNARMLLNLRNCSIKVTFIMNALPLNQIGYVEVVAVLC